MSGILEASYELGDRQQSLSHYQLSSVFYKLNF
ncbi:hypothetical protein F383_36812 [Gossypium arboreum]|uniref:Uncharacterized protein n=1 Tax=Gossypium arboreum TaxID=29729 RepID=A0A0B0M9N7_GOSAR|nr:hypothetical protein F383_36812 [Gossypium arboreum]